MDQSEVIERIIAERQRQHDFWCANDPNHDAHHSLEDWRTILLTQWRKMERDRFQGNDITQHAIQFAAVAVAMIEAKC